MNTVFQIDIQLFAQERTEPATPRRREEARRKGQVAKTAELSSALVLLGAFSALYLVSSDVARETMAFARFVFVDLLVMHSELSVEHIPKLLQEMTFLAMRLAMPVVACALFLGFGSQLLQVGFRTTSESLTPKFERINPVSGVKRILSKRALVELLKACIKVSVVGTITYSIITSSLTQITQFMQINPPEAAAITGRMVFRTGLWVAIAMLILAAFDYMYQRWEFEQSIRMSKQEVREEHRQTEGDPELRSKIRQRQRQIAGARMMSDVAISDVVITNPVHLAIALRYDSDEMEAPVVTAKGAGPLAQRIKERAIEHGVAVVENVWLARALYESVEINDTIPQELFQAVAEVLAFVYRLRHGPSAAG